MPQEKIKIFRGCIAEIAPKLYKKRMVPMNSAQITELRIKYENSEDEKTKKYLNENNFVTSDAIAIHPDKKVKIIRSFFTLRNVCPGIKTNILESKFIDEEIYENLDGIELNRFQVAERVLGGPKEYMEKDKVIRYLLRENAKDYVDIVYKGERKTGGAIKIGEYPVRFIEIRPIVLDEMTYGSNINTLGSIYDKNANVIAVPTPKLANYEKAFLTQC